MQYQMGKWRSNDSENSEKEQNKIANTIKKIYSVNTLLVRLWRKKYFYMLLDGVQMSTTSMEDNLAISLKIPYSVWYFVMTAGRRIGFAHFLL